MKYIIFSILFIALIVLGLLTHSIWFWILDAVLFGGGFMLSDAVTYGSDNEFVESIARFLRRLRW